MTLPHPQALLAGVQQPNGGQQVPHALLAAAQQGWGVHLGVQQWAVPPAGLYSPAVPGWDASSLASNFQTMSLQQPPSTNWYFDSGASNHMTSDAGITTTPHTPRSSFPSHIVVSNGHLLPVTSTGVTTLPNNLHLNNVLVSPGLIKNLILVLQFTSDNNCSVEFDPLGCSVKDLHSRREIVRCDSFGPLYPLQLPESASALLAASSPSLWHQRLGHPGHEVLSRLAQSSAIPCNNSASHTLCHACQLGRHTRLPFHASTSRTTHIFQLIHCDLWTSPIPSVSGHKYYLVVLDDFSHYLWTFPLRLKSDTFSTLSNFFAYVATQFGVTVQGIQCDNGHEFDNHTSRAFFLSHGVQLRMSCPYTSS